MRMHKHRQQRIYELNPEAVHGVEDWARQMTVLWNERFDRLEALLTEEASGNTKLRTRKDKGHGEAK